MLKRLSMVAGFKHVRLKVVCLGVHTIVLVKSFNLTY